MAKKKTSKKRTVASRDGAHVMKVAFNIKINPLALELARNAVFWTPGLTVSTLVENAILREVARLERQRGEPFRKRKGPLRTGRPVV